MAWEQWIIPVVLLGGIGALYYLMAKKGIGGCGSMMSSYRRRVSAVPRHTRLRPKLPR